MTKAKEAGMRNAAQRAAAASAALKGQPAPALPVRAAPAKSKPARQPIVAHLDATEERIRQAVEVDDDGEQRHYRIIDAMIDRAGERARLTRRFTDTWIERFHARGLLTYAQWFACDWYYAINAAAMRSAKVVADYGSGAGGAGCENYGQPQSERQWEARRRLRAARAAIHPNLVAIFERAVLFDEVPRFLNGQQRARFAATLGRAAQSLAVHLQVPGATP